MDEVKEKSHSSSLITTTHAETNEATLTTRIDTVNDNEKQSLWSKKQDTDPRFNIAVVYLKDALEYRQSQLTIQNTEKSFCFGNVTRLKIYRFIHGFFWKKLVISLIWLNMFKSFWEPPGKYEIVPIVQYIYILFYYFVFLYALCSLTVAYRYFSSS